ncbi:S8 family serine peptidase [Saliterribacillus persicus]|uniref:Minor extracellular serine protease Vpr n=1 Tax=Saliterribacillus persicus TaxID=930114 RepID=A0A368YEY4_9BACI|nr:S8 family serine peptidase [Saliterribacillus persicus]RCW77437.1 minor extracellular serine protease Vpr [Saliterribacillus persicus]
MHKIIPMLILTLLLVAFDTDKETYIIEVKGDPHEVRQKIERHHPRLEIVEVYDTIFNGLAIRATKQEQAALNRYPFFKKSYPNLTYKTQEEGNLNQTVPFLLSESIPYTGKGVKVGVIDTGIDYSHPDLQANVKGGYDFVDFDDDPMETLPEEGEPTLHGTHVAGVIAANGRMKGIAPDAELYGYRALGPGGAGTSVQVMAAIERAVKDGMDIINLSLGNEVNGPDWPTSVAVNKATENGVTVVAAAGNAGPLAWTLGSPATATSSIAVGASTPTTTSPFLTDKLERREMKLQQLIGAPSWSFTRDMKLTINKKEAERNILLVERGEKEFGKIASEAQELGASAVVIYNNEKGAFQGSIEGAEIPITIPVVSITKEDGQFLKGKIEEKDTYWIDTIYKKSADLLADFSSRGPVTVNWAIKPDLLAPGTEVTSTIPGGYKTLQGTSMAAPHVAGALALIKEAHPNWGPSKLKAALVSNTDLLASYKPSEQGVGKINVAAAIRADTLIYDHALNFGKIDQKGDKYATVTIENVSKKEKTYTFHQPNLKIGTRFDLPKRFTLPPKEKKTVKINLSVNPIVLDQGIHEGYLTLNDIKLPYLYINQTAAFPKAMGMDLQLLPLSKGKYEYQVYVTEGDATLTIDLYDPDTFRFIHTLVERSVSKAGVITGELKEKEMPKPGTYLANVEVKTNKGDVSHYQTIVEVPLQ